MIKKLFVGITALILAVNLSAQNVCSCDDFTRELKGAYDQAFRSANYPEATKITKQLASSTDKCCKAKAQIMFANIHFNEDKFDSVRYRVVMSEKILGDTYDSLVTPEQFRLRGQVCAAQEKPDSTIYYYLEGLKNSEQHNNIGYVVKFCNDISYTFAGINQADRGLPYMKLAVEKALEIKDNALCAMAYSNLATTYGMMAETTGNSKYIDSLSVFAPLSLKYAKLANDRMYMIKSYNILGGLAVTNYEFDKAIAYCDTVISQLPPKGMEQLMVSALYRKGQSQYALGYMETSLQTLHQGLTIAKTLNISAIVQLFYQQLYYTYKDNRDPDNALLYLEKYKSLNDSLMNIEKSTIINSLEQQYNKEKNEQTIKGLSQEKQVSALRIRFLIAGVAVALFLALSILLIYRQKLLKQQQTILETEQRLNRARMNPHFFFNALTALQSFALRENDGKQLANNLSKFSHIMRETLESSYKDYVTIEQEVDFLREYLELQKIRFPNKFTYHLDLVKDIETESLMIPSMIIQPFVENSIEHGFSGITYHGELKVLFDEEQENVVIIIIDNGKGLISGTKENNEHISRASQIIKDRIYLLNIKLKTKASFTIDNNNNEPGVIVKIYLPKINKDESTAN